jgi:beta-glucosidase-like glycosyl hydrolase
VERGKQLLVQRATNLNNADLNNKEKDQALLHHLTENARIALQDNNKEKEEREERSKQRELKTQSTVLLKEDLELEEERKPREEELEEETGELKKMTKRLKSKPPPLSKLRKKIPNKLSLKPLQKLNLRLNQNKQTLKTRKMLS